MASSDTVVLNYEGERVALKDLKEGDLLLGPTGECQTVRDITRGSGRLYRVHISSRGDLYLSQYAVVSVLKRVKTCGQSRDGPTVDDHLAAFAQKYGALPDPLSSEAGNVDGERNKRTQKVDFWSALRTAIKWQLTFPRTENAARQLRNYLNGAKGITQNTSSYHFNTHLGKNKYKRDIFAWGNSARGKSPKNATWFDSREEAFQAVLACSRRAHNSGAVTVANLLPRFHAAGDGNSSERCINVDENLPGMDLVWRSGKTGLSLRVNGKYEGVMYNRYFAFPGLPRTDLLPTAVIPDSEDDPDDQGDDTTAWLAKVIAGAQGTVLNMDLQSLAGLETTKESKVWFYRSPGSDWPFQQVPVHPYFLGLWLGDGNRKDTGISNNHEPELREFLTSHAAGLDMHLVNYGGIQYHTVATVKPGTSTGPTLPQTRPVYMYKGWRPGRPNYWKAIVEQRLAAGWTFQPNRKKGEKRVWRRPHALEAAETGTGRATLPFDPDTHTRPEGGAASDYDPSSQVHQENLHADNTLANYTEMSDALPANATTVSTRQKHQLGSSPPTLATEPPRKKRLPSGVHGLPSSSPTESDDELPSIDTVFAQMTKRSETTVAEHLLSDSAMQDIVGPLKIPYDPALGDVDDDALSTDVSEYEDDDDDIEIITTHDVDAEEDQLVDNLIAEVSDVNYTAEDIQQPRNVNKLMRALRSLDVVTPGHITGAAADKKHVPQLYKKNTREVRMDVLAGMVDSDGYYDYRLSAIEISQSESKHARLFWDVVQLAQSLGFSVITRKKFKPLTQCFAAGWHLVMSITGDIAQIPCLLLRKQPDEHLTALRAGYSLKGVMLEEEETEWTSFRLSGNSHELYLRADSIVLCAAPLKDANVNVDVDLDDGTDAETDENGSAAD
nr:hypothetical protein B0A51_11809 [Rachicladosporium sp. CCFEE 5018]